MLSPYSTQLAQELQLKPGSVSKLVPNPYNKEKYILHYRNLKLYLQLGMELAKINRILQFKQAAWLKPYIDLNTAKRARARNGFEKDFFKLMNNSVFRKTMKNIRKHMNVKLLTTETNFVIGKNRFYYRRKPVFLSANTSFVTCKNRFCDSKNPV